MARPHFETVARTFDDDGNLSTQTDGRGSLGYAYDELNRLETLTDTNSDVLAFTYDPEGNLTQAALPNGVTTTMSYDDANRLASTSSVDGSSNVLQSFDYDYNDAGQRTLATDRNSDATAYAYDALGRLTSFDPPGSGSTSYDYDDAGNRTQAGAKTFSYNALNELTSDSTGTSYTYDGAGRLTEIDDGSTTTDMSYDALDQMIGIDDGTSPISFSYDALGRRSERTSGSGTTTAHYGDLTDIATRDSDGDGTIATYLQGPTGLVEQSDGTDTFFPLPDAHGDVTTLTDDAGAVDSRQEYDPWGVQLSGPGLEMGWLGAQERRADPQSGVVQMGIRGYAPGLGHFVSEDPVPYVPGMGQLSALHAYTANDPIDRTDLGGRSIFDDAGDFISSWADDPFNFGDPREMVSAAQEQWVQSDTPIVAPVAGSAVSMVDVAVNPDRLDDYVKSSPWNDSPLFQAAVSCWSPGSQARLPSAATGGFIGAFLGAASAVDLGAGGKAGVGGVSALSGARKFGAYGFLAGCASGIVSDL